MPADVKSIFLAAADKPAAERATYLDAACAGDIALRQRVEALLKAHDAPSTSPATAQHAAVGPAPEDLAPLFPQLNVLELVGAGGMGAVYKARQPALDRLVALKVLPRIAGDDPAFAERFTREARTLAKLSHPGIVSVYDFGSTGGLYWFVMEYVDGVNLRQAQRAGELTPAAALAVVPQICAALQYAHDEGVVHRDIKPENVLLDRKGRVKIADFGIAKLLGHDAAPSPLTGAHQAMGTPHYMAPEQWERPLAVDHRADIYSLGVVFYELLTGELPLGRFLPPSQKVSVDVRLDDVVLRTLEREPERRYQHVSDVQVDVEKIAAESVNQLSLDEVKAAQAKLSQRKADLEAVEQRLAIRTFELLWAKVRPVPRWFIAVLCACGLIFFVGMWGAAFDAREGLSLANSRLTIALAVTVPLSVAVIEYRMNRAQRNRGRPIEPLSPARRLAHRWQFRVHSLALVGWVVGYCSPADSRFRLGANAFLLVMACVPAAGLVVRLLIRPFAGDRSGAVDA